MSNTLSEWNHKIPAKYYDEAVNLLGEPTSMDNSKYGFCYWKPDENNLFDEHLLRDEYVPHCVPKPHHDYFYSSIKFYVPGKKLKDVLRISGSINYDGLKKLLTARCGGIGANYATLYLGMKIAAEELTINKVKKNDMYPKMINAELMSYKEMENEMKQLKKTHNNKYKKEVKSDYADYAFDECYKENNNHNGGSKTKKKKKNSKKKIN